MTVSIHWFRRDLRLRANPALFSAPGSSKHLYGAYWLGEMDALNERQRTFVVGCLKQLRATLDRRDASLTLLDRPAEEALPAMASRLGATAVYAARAYSGRELETEMAVRSALGSIGVDLH